MNFDTVADIIADLSILRFFPNEPAARLAIVRMAGEMADNEEQVRWLVRRTLNLHNEWPGPLEFRAVFCSKFRPRDGIEKHSEIYPDGIPSEKPAVPSLPSGAVNPRIANIVHELAEVKSLPAPKPVKRQPFTAGELAEAEKVLAQYREERERRMQVRKALEEIDQ